MKKMELYWLKRTVEMTQMSLFAASAMLFVACGGAPEMPPGPRVYKISFDTETELTDRGRMSQSEYDAMRTAVLRLHDGNNQPLCSATVVGQDRILTAAHCTNVGAFIRIGLHDALNFSAIQVSRENTKCADTCGRNDYRPRSHDIAVLTTQTPVDVVPIAPAYATTYPDMILLGYRGQTEALSARVVCGAQIEASVISAEDPDNLIVEGDSGGPLIGIDRNGSPRVLGVVSGRSIHTTARYFAPIQSDMWFSQAFGTPVEALDGDNFRHLTACHVQQTP